MSNERKIWMIGCDWGTSSFRLRLVDVSTSDVIEEVTHKEGVAFTHTQWKAQESSGNSRFDFFKQKLKVGIDSLAGKVAFDLDGLPVVVTGMASASIGMHELPYATLPFSLDTSGLLSKYFEPSEDFKHPLWLVSGVRDTHDVMRGEEVQLVGLANLLKLGSEVDSIIILPGTHSKHCFISGANLVGFQTFLTGELFALMTTHSILKDSVEVSGVENWNSDETKAFVDGVESSQHSNLLATLFTVRTNSLFNVLSKRSNAYYLSGLLIGAEVGYLNREGDVRPIFLCGGSHIHALYTKALEALNLSSRVQILPEGLVDKATINGQLVLYKYLSEVPIPALAD